MKQSEEKKPRGRPKGSKTRQERRKPVGVTQILSARVSLHTAAMLSRDAVSKGVEPGTLLAEMVSRRWRCRCDECRQRRRELRAWSREVGGG